jgi:hypothetical protein
MSAGQGWTTIFVDEWGTLAEELLAPEAGTYGLSYVPGPGEHWVIQGVALRACH